MDYPDTFAGLALAVVDSGVDPETLLQLETCSVCSVSEAVRALEMNRLPPVLSASVQAVLTLALGPSAVPAVLGPPTKMRRKDLPVAQPTAAGSLSKALASAQPDAREATIERFRRDIWAPSNQGPPAARWRTWAKVCDAWAIPALPLTMDSVEKVAAALKEGGYRSARQYFACARREQVLQTKTDVPPEVLLMMRDAVRSLERGVGGPALKDAFRFEEVVLPERRDVCLFVLGCWFLMREIEIAAMQRKHFPLDHERQEVVLTLAASKCDQKGSLVLRRHGCYYEHIPARMCPFHQAAAFEKLCPKNPEEPLFMSSHGGELSKKETISVIRGILFESSMVLKRAGARGQGSLERFRGHVLRVSVAQFLARRLVPLPTIMLLGRWGSRAVERYVQDPLWKPSRSAMKRCPNHRRCVRVT